MNKIHDEPCRKCGGATSIHWIPSTGMDIQKTGMQRTCSRCGFSEFIDSLDDEKGKVAALKDEIKGLKGKE